MVARNMLIGSRDDVLNCWRTQMLVDRRLIATTVIGTQYRINQATNFPSMELDANSLIFTDRCWSIVAK